MTINPYHFIPLTERKVKYDKKKDALVSGKLMVKIGTKTPLFIPNTSCEYTFERKDEHGHKSYDFFSYNTINEENNNENSFYEPIIPGSEIRGMIRNIYETLTASCLSSVDDVSVMQRTNFSFKPGLIKRNENNYQLYKNVSIASIDWNSKEIDINTLSEGQVVYGKPEDNGNIKRIYKLEDNKTAENKKGYLLIGEPGPKKHNAKMFYNPPQKGVDISIEGLKNVLKSYEKSKVKDVNLKHEYNNYRKYRKEFKRFCDGDGEEFFPVYYYFPIEKNDEICYLSPACITKKAMKTTIGEILKNQGNFNPCSSTDDLCPACYLFGMVNNKVSKASSLRFADARLKGTESTNQNWKSFYQDKVVLQELSTPKLSATEFYLERPSTDAVFWTYDYWINKGNIKKKYNAKIAGRKYYWHNLKSDFSTNAIEDKNNKTIRPVMIGNENDAFYEEIYFDSITEEQLKQLIYICDISHDGLKGYKLGAGKPLGFGSISMTVTEILVREIQLDENNQVVYKEKKRIKNNVDFKELFPESGEILDSFEIMTTFKSVENKLVTYPIIDSQRQNVENGNAIEEGFKWFGENRVNKIGNIEKIKEYMPKLTRKCKTLKKVD